MFGREFNLLDLLILWDAILGVGDDLEFTYYIVVAMLIHVRDKRESTKYLNCFTFHFVLHLFSALKWLHKLLDSLDAISAKRRCDAHHQTCTLHEVTGTVSVSTKRFCLCRQQREAASQAAAVTVSKYAATVTVSKYAATATVSKHAATVTVSNHAAN